MHGSTEDSFEELAPPGAGIRIAEAAQRGISLKQLLEVLLFIFRRCDDEGSVCRIRSNPSVEAREATTCSPALKFKSINLYELNSWLIKPATARDQCSYVELVSTDAAEQRPEWFVSHWWGEPVSHFIFCLQEFSRQRGYRAVFWVCAYCNNQHALTKDITMDPSRSSFGRALKETRGVVMVLDRNATPFKRTWCAFEMAIAIRSEEKPRPTFDIATFVPDEIDEDDDAYDGEDKHRDTSPNFVGLETGSGEKLCITGNVGSTPSAIELESYLTLKARGHVRLVSDGRLPQDDCLDQVDTLFGRTPSKKKALREKSFPLKAAAAGLSMAIECAEASNAADKQHILNFIAGRTDLGADYPAKHPEYDNVNDVLRARFAMAMLRKTVEEDQADLWQQALVAISKDTKSVVMDFDFDGCGVLTGAAMSELAQSLPSQLQGLNLHCDRCTLLSDTGLQGLGLGLKRLAVTRSLAKLRIDVRGCTLLTSDGLGSLATGLLELGSLVEFHTSFEDVHWGKRGLLSISRSLHGLSNLHHLTINWQSCDADHDPMENDALHELSVGLGTLRNLKTFTFDCSYCKSAGLVGFGVGFEVLSRLEVLTLNFTQCMGVDTEGVQSLATGLSHLSGLTSLSLNFEDCFNLGIGLGGGVAKLGKAIGRLGRLCRLELNFQGCTGLSDDDLRGFGLGLGSAYNLQEMALYFQGTNLGRAALEGIGASIGTMWRLTRVEVDFARCSSVEDVGIKSLCAGLGKLRRLVLLIVRFFGCSFGESGLQALGSSLQQVCSLEHFEGEFFGLFRIGDGGLRDFGAGIQRLTKLKNLELNFYRCNFESEGLGNLGGGFSSLSQLLNLNLDLRYSVQYCDDSFMEEFALGLGRLESLRRLRLDFGGCQSMTDEGLESLSSALESMYSLEALRLDCGDCYQVGDHGLRQVAKGLRERMIYRFRKFNALELQLCFLFTAVRPKNQWITCGKHLLRVSEEVACEDEISDAQSDEGAHITDPSPVVRRARRAASILHDPTAPRGRGPGDILRSRTTATLDTRIRRAVVPDPHMEQSLVSRGIFADIGADASGLPISVPNLYEVSPGNTFVFSFTERNRAYVQRPDDRKQRCPELSGSQSTRKAFVEIPLSPGKRKFDCQLVLRVTERWGIKFAGVAVIAHPDGRQHIVYLPGVLSFDPAGITGDPHSSERVGPACDRMQVGLTVAQLSLLQYGGTRADLARMQAVAQDIIECYSGRLALCKWMQHQVQKACLEKGRSKPYPVFLQELVDEGSLVIQSQERSVTQEYLDTFICGNPVVPEAYLRKVSAKDRCCFGRSAFGGLTTKLGPADSDDPSSLWSPWQISENMSRRGSEKGATRLFLQYSRWECFRRASFCFDGLTKFFCGAHI